MWLNGWALHEGWKWTNTRRIGEQRPSSKGIGWTEDWEITEGFSDCPHETINSKGGEGRGKTSVPFVDWVYTSYKKKKWKRQRFWLSQEQVFLVKTGPSRCSKSKSGNSAWSSTLPARPNRNSSVFLTLKWNFREMIQTSPTLNKNRRD